MKDYLFQYFFELCASQLQSSTIISETLVRPLETLVPYTGLEKFLFLYSCLCVCVCVCHGRRNYPLLLKFGTNVYTLSKTTFTVFDVHCLNSACTRTHKTISTHYDTWREMSLYSCLCVCVSRDNGHWYYRIRLKFGIHVYAIYEISYINFGAITQIGNIQRYKKHLNTLRFKKGNSLKSVLTCFLQG